MMSTMSPVFLTEQCSLNPFSTFETGFGPWDGLDLFSIIQPPREPVGLKPVFETPDVEQNRNPPDSSSGSEEKTEKRTGSEDNLMNRAGSGPVVPDFDERRKRRKISNRESARRSRLRKQEHLESIWNQLNRLKVENRELTNRLRLLMYHSERVRMDNDRLRLEHGVLSQKLLNTRQVQMLRQIQQHSTYAMWPCNDNTVTNYEQNPLTVSDHVI